MDMMVNDQEMQAVMDIRTAFDACDKADADWIETRVDLALALQRGRERCADNRVFGVWLVENGLDRLGNDDRAALLNIAANADLFRVVAMASDSRSVRLIWQDMQKQSTLRSPAKNGSDVETSETAPDSPEKPETSSGPQNVRKSPLAKLKGGEMMLAIFSNAVTRHTLNKLTKGGSQNTPAWSFLVTFHTAEKTPPTDASIGPKTHLRLLYPWLPGIQKYIQRFDLNRKEHRAAIMEEILPVIREHEADLRERPERLHELVDARQRKLRREAREANDKANETAAIAAMPANEETIIYCGVRLWPQIETEVMPESGYDYTALCFALWYFRDQEQALSTSPAYQHPADLARVIRERTRFPFEYSLLQEPAVKAQNLRFWGAVKKITHLYERMEGQGVCHIPAPPSVIKDAVPSLAVMPA